MTTKSISIKHKLHNYLNPMKKKKRKKVFFNNLNNSSTITTTFNQNYKFRFHSPNTESRRRITQWSSSNGMKTMIQTLTIAQSLRNISTWIIFVGVLKKHQSTPCKRENLGNFYRTSTTDTWKRWSRFLTFSF